MTEVERLAAWSEGFAAAEAEAARGRATLEQELSTALGRALALEGRLQAREETARHMSLHFMQEVLKELGRGALRMDLASWIQACQTLAARVDGEEPFDLLTRPENAADAESARNADPSLRDRMRVRPADSLPPGHIQARQGERAWTVAVADAARAVSEALTTRIQDEA